MIDEDRREDPWNKARDAQREDVAGIFAPRERRCPACGAEQRADGRTCTNCGADLSARYERRTVRNTRRPLLFAAVVAIVLIAVAIPVIASLRSGASDERAREAVAQKARVAAERARQIRDGKPMFAAGPEAAAGESVTAHRAQLLTAGEALITQDARDRVAAGTLDGDIKGTSCTVFPATDARRAAETDPATPAARYDCVAYTSKLEGNDNRTAVFGHPFWLVVDFKRDRFTWCKTTPRAGEGGSVLISVPVAKPCRDPAGPG
jgi:hypothetical protein